MTTREEIEQLIDKYKERYNNKEWLVAISEVIQNLKFLSEQPTYEQWFERWKQVGYKEWWRARVEEPKEEREIEIELNKSVLHWLCKCWWQPHCTSKYCPECWAKIKRVS